MTPDWPGGFTGLAALAQDVGAALTRRGQTLAISESSSGGLISAALLCVPGASGFYRGAGIIYTPQAFRGLLGLTREDLAGMRSATEAYARLVAGVMRTRLRADWGLCETGAAGPSGNAYGDEAGHCCFALIGPDSEAFSETIATGLSDRAANMGVFAARALGFVRDHLA